MTTADGSVLGAVKIVDNGPDYLRYTIGLLPDGYTAAEMPKWETDAQAAVDRLLSEAPFSDLELRCAFNVYRVDVISDEAGADDPKCGGPGLGSKAATYFDATFCAEKDLRRSMDFDSETAVLTLLAHVPLWRMGVVIVNSPVQGGTGGTIPVMSTGGSDWLHGFVHELGHSAFGLADEYEYLAGCATSEEHYLHDSVEPIEPNVTANLGPADFPLVKWGALIDPATPIPTTTNPTCNICDPATSSPLAGTVGAYEGAHYYHCRAWRPDFDCMMRTIRGSFCAVCQGVIRAVLAPFANPVVVTPLSTTVTFADTEAGTTVPSSVAFTVESCVDLTFVVRDGPRRIDGGPADYAGAPVLDLPFGNLTSSEAVPGGGARTANVWVTYQATEPGDLLLGFITVECAETGEFFSFLITGNTVAPVTVGVLLCLDESASMLEPATGSESKGVALQQAAEILVDVIGAAEGIGVITFSTDASGAPVIDAGEGLFGAGRVSARNDIASYAPDPQGLTSLGNAVERADAILAGAASRYDGTAMVVFTDGKETASKYLSEVTGLISANTKIFAVGLGTAANLDPAALDTLCGGSGGELLLTGTDPGDTFFLLAKYFLNILAGATNTEIVSDPAGYLVNGAAPCRIPFTLNETDTSVDAILVTPVPTAVRFAIETPTGEVITPTTPVPGTSYVQGRNNAHYRVSLPALIGQQPAREGVWYAVLSINTDVWTAGDNAPLLYAYLQNHPSAVINGLPYALHVQARSNLSMTARCLQDSYEPSAELRVRAILTEYGLPIDGRASVRAEMTRPDGTAATLSMAEIEPGVFEALEVAHQSGVYHFYVVAKGHTLRDYAFTREQIVTGFTYHGGDTPSAHDPRATENCCNVLQCLVGALSPQFCDRMGIDLDRLRRCLSEHCADPHGAATTTPADIDPADIDLIRDVATRLGLIGARARRRDQPDY